MQPANYIRPVNGHRSRLMQTLRKDQTPPSAGNQIKDSPCGYAAQNLGNNIGRQLFCRKTPTGPEAKRNRRIQMAAGYVSDGKGHRKDSEAECQGYAKQSYTNIRESSR